jgi:hypothetical protein
MEKRVTIEKYGEYYRLIAALYDNDYYPVRVEEIVESKSIKEAKRVLFELLPDWKNIKIEGD